MNKLIKEQLKKVTSVMLDVKDDVTHFVIPKATKFINSTLKQDQCYLIEIKDSVLHPDENSTLASNWNGGRIPKNKYYKAEVVAKMANMIKFNGVSINDDTDNWYGWIPVDQFIVINKQKN